ncbi:MAG: hypothetical protein U1F66_04265 [bacterium]
MHDNAPMREWHYHIDAEGNLWHDGSVFEDPHTLNFFMRKLEKLPDGRYHALCQGEECYFEPEDTLYVVRDVELHPDHVDLTFQGGYRERLDPHTLHVGKNNVFYCCAREGRFEARFNRKPYLELARWIDYDPREHRFFLKLAGEKFPIQGVSA